MNRQQRLDLISETIKTCTKCEALSKGRINTVPGEGDHNSKIMFVGEGPGQTEDETGRPFVGPAGELLTAMIQACGWNRKDVFICNVVKCRPPNNRKPTCQEMENCWNYLDLQIKTVNPKFIVCLGSTAANKILGIQMVGITSLRGKIHAWKNRKVICTYHPSYILHAENDKKADEIKRLVWEDLQLLLNEVDSNIES